MTAPRYLVGVDVGGTFTDILGLDARSGSLLSAKVPSLPDSQWRGVLDALAALGIERASVEAFVHGTTIATNALLERKGAKTALVTTEGFRDTLEIGRTRRLVGGLFDIKFVRPKPLVRRALRFEVPERIAADGTVLRGLDGYDYAPLVERLKGEGVEAVAVCFVNAFVNGDNERRAGAALAARLDGVPVCESAAVVREKGEFERFSTCVLNAYLTPVVRDYLDRLTRELAARGVTAPVGIMGSNGGAMTLAKAAEFAAGTFLSGPVGGVGGAVRVCELRESPTASLSTWAARLPTWRWSTTGPPAYPMPTRSMPIRSRCRSSTSTPSAPAAARSLGSRRTARSRSARAARAPCRGRPATARAARRRRSRTPTCCSDACRPGGRSPAG